MGKHALKILRCERHFLTLWVKELWEDTAHRNFLFILKQ